MPTHHEELVIIGGNVYSEHGARKHFRSGLEQQMNDLAHAFSRTFHYSPKSIERFAGFVFDDAVTVQTFSERLHESHHELWRRKKEYWQRMKEIHAAHPNAIFLVYIPDSYIGLLAALYLKKKKAKWFVRVTSNQMAEMRARRNSWQGAVAYYSFFPWHFLFMRWLLRGVPQIYTGKKVFYKNKYAFSVCSSSIRNEDIAERTVREREKKVIYYVGRYDAVKGLPFLLAALPLIRHPVTLKIIGFGEAADERRIRELIAASPRKNDIELLGYVPFGPALFAHYDAADMMVIPTVYETQGKSFLEAMARGAAVIASRTGGMPLFIKDGENGMLVPPKDPRAIAAVVDRVAGDPVLQAKLVARGYETARKNTIEMITATTLRVIDTFFS